MRKSSASASSTIGWSCTASPSTATADLGERPSGAVAAARLAAFLLWLGVCVPLHLATKLLFGRSGWPQRFLGGAAAIAGVRISATGAPVQPHTLLVCNHVSWLDVLVMARVTGCAFVSKHELGHPVMHWLADQNATLYVRRDHKRGSPEQAEAIARKLKEPQPLALFPEGTTGHGRHLLPFRPTLFAAVAPAPAEVAVRPVAIDYGNAAAEIGWHEEPGKQNLFRVLGRRRPLAVTVRLLDPLPASADRKALASAARDAIETALASSPSRANL